MLFVHANIERLLWQNDNHLKNKAMYNKMKKIFVFYNTILLQIVTVFMHTVVAKKDKTTLSVKLLTFWPPLISATQILNEINFGESKL